jgi:hypothetical protein
MLNPSDKTITRTQQANPPPSFAHHQPYLLQGVLNFFMEQGKVALVASEDDATQAWFEGALAQQVEAQLDCKIIRLQTRADEDTLETFNALLSQISVQQATQTTGQRQANYLLWVSENEHFTPERFQLLKNIILQFSGLQLKLLVSVTSDSWSGRLFDIAGRKIAYWFIPSAAPVRHFYAAAAAIPAAPSAADFAAGAATATGENTEPAATTAAILADRKVPQPATAQATRPQARRPGRNINQLLPIVGLVVLIGAAAFWLQDWASTTPPATQGKTPAGPASPPKANPAKAPDLDPGSAPKTPLLDQASAAQPQASGSASAIDIKTASPALEVKPPTPAPAPQITAINTLADCPKGAETDTAPTAKPTSFVKDTNYIFIKSRQNRKICIAPAGGPYRILNLQANQGNSAYGNSPWRVYSPELRQIEIYFQGARVLLSANVKDTVTVIPR